MAFRAAIVRAVEMMTGREVFRRNYCRACGLLRFFPPWTPGHPSYRSQPLWHVAQEVYYLVHLRRAHFQLIQRMMSWCSCSLALHLRFLCQRYPSGAAAVRLPSLQQFPEIPRQVPPG